MSKETPELTRHNAAAHSPHERHPPFKGRILNPSAPIRVLHRFTKPGHWFEIRERKVTTFRAIEYIVFMDGSLLDSMLFHGAREAEYLGQLAIRIKQFTDGGWVEEPFDVAPRSDG